MAKTVGAKAQKKGVTLGVEGREERKKVRGMDFSEEALGKTPSGGVGQKNQRWLKSSKRLKWTTRGGVDHQNVSLIALTQGGYKEREKRKHAKTLIQQRRAAKIASKTPHYWRAPKQPEERGLSQASTAIKRKRRTRCLKKNHKKKNLTGARNKHNRKG